jgi:hypothetical protein
MEERYGKDRLDQVALELPSTPILDETVELENHHCTSFKSFYDSNAYYFLHTGHQSSNHDFIGGQDLERVNDTKQHIIYPPLLPTHHEESSYTIHTPLEAYDSAHHRDQPSRFPIFRGNGSCWVNYEDVEGKPGWISENCFHNRIIFVVEVGQYPVLSLSYFTTYISTAGMMRVGIGKTPIHLCHRSRKFNSEKHHHERHRHTRKIRKRSRRLAGEFNSTTGSNETDPSYEQCIATTQDLYQLALKDPKDYFRDVLDIDGSRANDDWARFSISEDTLLYAGDGRAVPAGTGMVQLQPNVLLPNSIYLLSLETMDANGDTGGRKNKNPRTNPQKFKLFTIASC